MNSTLQPPSTCDLRLGISPISSSVQTEATLWTGKFNFSFQNTESLIIIYIINQDSALLGQPINCMAGQVRLYDIE